LIRISELNRSRLTLTISAEHFSLSLLPDAVFSVWRAVSYEIPRSYIATKSRGRVLLPIAISISR
jgi:hypothetical protein